MQKNVTACLMIDVIVFISHIFNIYDFEINKWMVKGPAMQGLLAKDKYLLFYSINIIIVTKMHSATVQHDLISKGKYFAAL